MTRTLTLKREALQDLSTDELRDVAGGSNSFSCLDYISCFPWQCIPTFALGCVE